jgi:hypothetical protein
MPRLTILIIDITTDCNLKIEFNQNKFYFYSKICLRNFDNDGLLWLDACLI